MHGRVPRPVVALNGVMIDASMNMVCAGWIPLMRAADPQLVDRLGVTFTQLADCVLVQANELEAARTYCVGQWLTDSGGIQHTKSWAAWLTDAYARGNALQRYAVVRTIHRFIHRDRRRTRGMLLYSPLYDMLPRFLALYDNDLEGALLRGTLLTNVRALLQLQDPHVITWQALAYAWEWTQANKAAYLPAWTLIAQIRCKHVNTRPPPFVALTLSGCNIFYFFVLRAPRDIAKVVFEGITLRDKRVAPREIRGTWCGGNGSRTTRKCIMYRFILFLEYNSYLLPTERYLMPQRSKDEEQHQVSRDVWCVRREYKYATGPSRTMRMTLEQNIEE